MHADCCFASRCDEPTRSCDGRPDSFSNSHEPVYPAEIAQELGLTRSNVSNHLACLRDCGIVVVELEGRQNRYEIVDAHLARALNALVETTLAVDENAPCLDMQCPVEGCCSSEGGRR